jgi:hypothetical protein
VRRSSIRAETPSGIDETQRAETVSVAEFVAVARSLG